ncbi:MAG: TonB-dependent receptor [Bacteroidetes bacterium]|nr:TonB-dependent receptor [Bacteroidota bacterium]
MRKQTFLAFLIILLFSVPAFAQQGNRVKVEISGKVIDKQTKQPLVGAVLSVGNGRNGAISGENGSFEINLPAGKNVILNISFLGYKELNYSLLVPNVSTKLKNNIALESSNLKMEVEIVGKAPIGIVKGDTTQYNAGAFKVNPDASTQDLLAKMPGMTVNDNGSVTSMGENIEVIYVDGKSYFKNNVATALSSVPAVVVESVQVYDDRSPQAKFLNYDDGNNKKALNIVTKKAERKTNYIGDVMLGYGSDNRYMGSANFSMLGEKSSLVFGAGSNNINVSPNRQRRFYGMSSQSGITKATGARLNFMHEIKGGEITLSYIYDNEKLDALKFINKQYLSSSQITNKIDSSFNVYSSHKLDFEYSQTLNENNRLEVELSTNYSDTDDFDYSLQKNNIDGNITNVLTDTKLKGSVFGFKGSVDYIHKFNDKRDLSVSLGAKYSNDTSDKLQTGYVNSSAGTLNDEDINEKYFNDIVSTGFSGEFRYTEKLSKFSRLVFAYDTDYSYGDSDKKLYAYDVVKGDYVDLKKDLSNVFNNDYFVNSGGLGYVFSKKKSTLNMWVRYQNGLLDSETTFPENAKPLNKNYNSVNIKTKYKLAISKQKSLTIYASSTPSYPSISNLQEVLDVSDPLNVRNGNINLSPSQNNRFRIRYSSSNIKKSTVFRAMASINNTQNAVVNSTRLLTEDEYIGETLLTSGTQYTSPENMDGVWRLFTGAWYSFPLTSLKSNFEFGGMFMYSRSPSIYNDEKFVTNNYNPNCMFRFTSNISENVDFNIFNRVGYTYSTGSNDTKNRSISDNASLGANYIFLKSFFINLEYMFKYSYYYDTPNVTNRTHQLNMAVGKKFMNDKLELRVTGFDILGQNKAISQSVSDIAITSTDSNILQRYFAVSLRYKFNTMKKPMSNSKKGNKKGRRHGKTQFSM